MGVYASEEYLTDIRSRLYRVMEVRPDLELSGAGRTVDALVANER